MSQLRFLAPSFVRAGQCGRPSPDARSWSVWGARPRGWGWSEGSPGAQSPVKGSVVTNCLAHVKPGETGPSNEINGIVDFLGHILGVNSFDLDGLTCGHWCTPLDTPPETPLDTPSLLFRRTPKLQSEQHLSSSQPFCCRAPPRLLRPPQVAPRRLRCSAACGGRATCGRGAISPWRWRERDRPLGGEEGPTFEGRGGESGFVGVWWCFWTAWGCNLISLSEEEQKEQEQMMADQL